MNPHLSGLRAARSVRQRKGVNRCCSEASALAVRYEQFAQRFVTFGVNALWQLGEAPIGLP
jgi:hypothetical protein